MPQQLCWAQAHRDRQEARGLPSQLTRELRARGAAAPTLPLRALDLAELLLCVPWVGMPTVPHPLRRKYSLLMCGEHRGIVA